GGAQNARRDTLEAGQGQQLETGSGGTPSSAERIGGVLERIQVRSPRPWPGLSANHGTRGASIGATTFP
ncbi:hypothetical protein PpBr36_02556, partial [Pyricularia pennisetigena]|uniref:hypothetical protein n=1 Tax=Pyricularia pennisetigena TaxID=1578925 RepID=UPI001152F258